MKTYYPNDNLRHEGIFNNGRKEGLWKYYRQNSGLKAEEYWEENGTEILEWEKYYNKN